jgi:S1-C subfamily serine protease
MGKLFNPYKTKKQNNNIVFRQNPNKQNKPILNKRIYLFIAAMGLLFFLILVFSIGGKKNIDRTQLANGDETNSARLDKRPERSLPEGKLGGWAKSIVYIESGYIKNDSFFAKISGTGFVFSSKGKVMTNQHVVGNGLQILLTFYDGSTSYARVKRADDELDIAELETILPTTVKPLILDKDGIVKIGRKIIVMGFPLGAALGPEMTLTDGLISSVRKDNLGNLRWYQINAAVNSGNSGGPLIDAESGNVLGVVTAKIFEAENIGFARPISVVAKQFQGIFDE